MRTRRRRTLRCASSPAIKAFARFPAELSLRNHLTQQLRRLETRTERRREVFGDAEADVESDQIGETQRTHRMVVAELHRAIDVLRAGDPFFEHANRFESDGDAETGGRKAGRIANDDR